MPVNWPWQEHWLGMCLASVLVALSIQDASHWGLECVKEGSDFQWFGHKGGL